MGAVDTALLFSILGIAAGVFVTAPALAWQRARNRALQLRLEKRERTCT